MVVWGNYNTGAAGSLMIVFEKCNATRLALDEETADVKCAEDKDIDKWLVGRYIITLENQRMFTQHKFGEETFSTSAEVHWYPVTVSARRDNNNMIHRSTV